MHFFILVLLFCFFVFLFCLYFFAHDDFVLLRRDISLDQLFNIGIVASLVSLLSARLFFAFFHPSSNFLNPLYFLLFPYFPGLSFLGAVLGAALFLLTVFRSKKMPTGRLADLFSLCALVSIQFGAVGYFLLSGASFASFEVLFVMLSYFSLLLFFVLFVYPRFLKGRVEDGNMSILFLIAFSLISILSKIILKNFSPVAETIILILLLIFSTALLIRKEKVIDKLMLSRKKNG